MAGRTLHPAVEEAIALHRAAVDRVMLRTIYINPTFPTNGDGSTWTQAASNGAPGACNAWGTGTYAGTFDSTHFWRDNTRYLQAAETEVPTVTVYATDGSPMQGIILGTYDPATGDQIRDGTRHARIYRATGGPALQLSDAALNRRNILVDNIDARVADRTATTGFRFGISFNAPRFDDYTGIAIIRCILDGFRAVSGGGASVTILGNDYNGWGSGFELQSTDLVLCGNAIYHPEWETRQQWAGLTHVLPNGDGYTVSRLCVEYNDFRKQVMTEKECINLQTTPIGQTSDSTPSGPVTIRYNMCSGAAQHIRTTLDNTEIAYNTFDRIHNILDASPGGGACAVAVHAKSCYIHDNFAYSPPEMPYGTFAKFTYAATTGTHRVHRNTVVGLRNAASAAPSGASFALDMSGNVFTRSTYQNNDGNSAFVTTLGTVTYTAANNMFYGTNEGAIQFQVGYVNRTFAQYQSAVEPTAEWGPPDYDENYRPMNKANGDPGNLIAKVSPGGGYDITGRIRSYPATAGAYEYQRDRRSRTLP